MAPVLWLVKAYTWCRWNPRVKTRSSTQANNYIYSEALNLPSPFTVLLYLLSSIYLASQLCSSLVLFFFFLSVFPTCIFSNIPFDRPSRKIKFLWLEGRNFSTSHSWVGMLRLQTSDCHSLCFSSHFTFPLRGLIFPNCPYCNFPSVFFYHSLLITSLTRLFSLHSYTL